MRLYRHFAANMLTVLIVVIIVAGGLVTWGKRTFVAPGPLAETVFVEIPRGANIRTVAAALGEAGAISNQTIFRIGARYTDKVTAIKFGEHEISPGASMEDILEVLSSGAQERFRYEVTFLLRDTLATRVRERAEGGERVFAEFVPKTDDPASEIAAIVGLDGGVRYRVTLPEGMSAFNAMDGLANISILSGELVEVPPEGSLSPDTYEVRRGDSRLVLLDLMADKQSEVLAKAWAGRDPNLPLDTPDELLTLASIVEKETGLPGERGLVASVFVNRLNRGIRLQTDPSVIYGLTLGRETLGRGLRRSELDARTPWNTYLIDGLPPTPISNPGRAAIEAAANPDTSGFIFFVANGRGGHSFAATLKEHNANVAKWRKIERERASE